ncbi:MAG: hypothetical protein DRJ10_03550 [Bacteroidetes bacterium]|nr:MAG: hypothetical protein DRJ10_03550 [Bacteroidota bacterium]
MDKNIVYKIQNEFRDSNKIAVGQLNQFLKKQLPNITDATISWYIHQLYKESVINRVGRGMYSLSDKLAFKPAISAKLIKLHRKVHKEFPFIKFCVSETSWLNSFMIHQQVRHRLIVEAENDAVESVFYKISETNKQVYLNPSAEIYELYISDFDSIIIKTLTSQSPLKTIDGIKIPELEKLLIDILSDIDLYAAQQDELEYIYNEVYSRYNINMSKLIRYAKRRNREPQARNLINNISALNNII